MFGGDVLMWKKSNTLLVINVDEQNVAILIAAILARPEESPHSYLANSVRLSRRISWEVMCASHMYNGLYSIFNGLFFCVLEGTVVHHIAFRRTQDLLVNSQHLAIRNCITNHTKSTDMERERDKEIHSEIHSERSTQRDTDIWRYKGTPRHIILAIHRKLERRTKEPTSVRFRRFFGLKKY